MLHHDSFAEYFSLIHLEKTRVYFSPIGNAYRYRMQLGRVFVKWAVLDLVNPRY